VPPTTIRPPHPAIVITQAEAEQLTALALRAALTSPRAANLLLDEIERAELQEGGRPLSNVVAMNCIVEFVDGSRDGPQIVQVVYPGEADPAAGKVSVLGPIGAGLIGLKVGQTIFWPDAAGRERPLTVLAVRRPEVPGDR
jgi:regulator of nucleoside diphosphate kinase